MDSDKVAAALRSKIIADSQYMASEEARLPRLKFPQLAQTRVDRTSGRVEGLMYALALILGSKELAIRYVEEQS